MADAEELLRQRAPEAVCERVDTIARECAEKGLEHLEVFLAAVPRRIGRQLLDEDGEIEVGSFRVLIGAWRLCDLAAAIVLRATPGADDDATLERLYFQGDAEERRMILRALPFLNAEGVRVRLLQEAHRTNDQVIFESGVADCDLAAHALPEDDYRNVLLRAAFMDIPLDRFLGAYGRATPELSRMLLDFMTEREAAGRPTWAGSLPMCAHAPCDGVAARIIGDLWHGRDDRRLAAAAAARIIDDEVVTAQADARREYELVEEVRALL